MPDKREFRHRFAGLLALVLASSAECGQTVTASASENSRPGAADKGRYTLFNPTPRELMREMSTDRPDTTESPYTVDAGRPAPAASRTITSRGA